MDSSRSKSMVQGAMSMLASSIVGPNSTSIDPAPKQRLAQVEKSPQDIPHEDLMVLCMKMNKRMQVMEAKTAELLQRNGRLLEERKFLRDIISSATKFPFILKDDEDLNMSEISERWELWQRELSVFRFETKTPDTDTDRGAEMSDYPISVPNTSKCLAEQHLREHVEALEEELRQKNATIMELKNDIESCVSKKEEAIVFLQIQLQRLRESEEGKTIELAVVNADLESKERQLGKLLAEIEEKDIILKQYEEKENNLLAFVENLQAALEKAKDRIRDLEKVVGASKVLKAEQDLLLCSIRNDFRLVLEEKEALQNDSLDAQTFRAKTDELQKKVNGLSEENFALLAVVDEKNSFIARLRSEALSNERNHAMRTAMLATCEAQIESLKKEITLKDCTTKEALDRLALLQERLASSDARLVERTQELAQNIALHDEKVGQLSIQHTLEIEAIREKCDSSIDVIKRDFAKKSAIARGLIVEKEEEINACRNKIALLENEISSGAPSERRIFELAQAQAKRDAAYGVYSDCRELAFQQLQAALASRDMQLAELQNAQSLLTAEVVELRRSTKRDGVNMDYLKNVVLQYITFPTNSPERSSLIPVLAMLLQFNSKEMAEIHKCQQSSLLWGARPIKEVKRGLRAADCNRLGLMDGTDTNTSSANV